MKLVENFLIGLLFVAMAVGGYLIGTVLHSCIRDLL